MKVIKNNINWYDWQKDVLKEIFTKDSHGKIFVIKAKRQVGKSVVCESIILKFAVDNPKSFSVYLSPTMKQARKVFKEIKSAIQDTSIFFKSSESILEIIFRNGSTIQFLSAEQNESLRGYTVSGCLIIDETAYIDDEVIDICLPFVDANKAPIIMISTPYYQAGTFFDYYMDGVEKKDPYITSFNWSEYDTSALLSNEKLEFYRKRVAKDKFRTDYLGEFAELGSGIFGQVSHLINNNPRTDLKLYAGVDWSANGSDDTSLTIFNSEGEMVYIDAWNDLQPTENVDKVVKILTDWKVSKVTVELNSIGKVYYDLLKNKINSIKYSQFETNKLSLHGFNTTNDSKNKIVQKFQVAIENSEVTILDNEKLLKQMSQFESKLTTTGKVTYAAQRNGHDDMVMSTLIAYNSIGSGNYAVY